MPVESVTEYFEHFPILEIDYTFYRPLLESSGNPTQNFHVLKNYQQRMKNEDLVLLKAPQIIIARKLRRGPQKGEKWACNVSQKTISFEKRHVAVLFATKSPNGWCTPARALPETTISRPRLFRSSKPGVSRLLKWFRRKILPTISAFYGILI